MYMYIKRGEIIIILLPHLQFLLQEMHIYLQNRVLMVPGDYAFLLKGSGRLFMKFLVMRVLQVACWSF